MFTKILYSLCTEIDKPALKYLARYTGWFGSGWDLQTLMLISSLLAAYKLNETGKLVTF